MTVRGQGKRFVWGIEAVLAGRLMGYFFFECFLVVEVNERSLYSVTDCTKCFSLIDLRVGVGE